MRTFILNYSQHHQAGAFCLGMEDAMQELSGLDASFLYLEAPNMPMHVGGVSVIEGSLDFDAFRDLLETHNTKRTDKTSR